MVGSTRNYVWNHADQLICYYNQAGVSAPSVYTQYDYAGQDRVSKLVKTGSTYERTIYIDDIFEYVILETSTNTYEKNYIHIMDDQSRIAEVRINTGTAFPGDIGDDVVYNLEDQIGSSTVRLDLNGTIIDREEYYPFGDSSLRTFTYKRYRYVGKERDAESGLYYYGARYYAAWTCRFISVDPLASRYAQLTPYNYADNNPINDFDIDGMQDRNTESPTQNNSQNTIYGFQSQTDTKPSLPKINGVVGPWSNEFIEKNSPHIQLDEVVVTPYPDFAYPIDDIDERIAEAGISSFAPKLNIPPGITGGRQKDFAEWNYNNAIKSWNRLSLEDKWMGARKKIGFGALHEVAKKTMQPAAEGYAILGMAGGSGMASGLGSIAATSKNIRVFWSGTNSEARAIEAGFTPLGQTRAGQNLIKLTDGMLYKPAINGEPASQAYLWWARLSTKYAEGASGTVHVFQNAQEGVSMQSIWRLYEYPALKANPSVKKIIFH